MLNEISKKEVIRQAKNDPRWPAFRQSLWFDVCIAPVLLSMCPEVDWTDRHDWIMDNYKELQDIAFGPLDNPAE